MLARLTLLLLLALSGTLTAKEFHVAPDGSDAAAGTHEAPLATLTAARDAARRHRKSGGAPEPIIILLHGGMHALQDTLILTPEDSGTPNAPLIIRGEPSGTPILHGGVPIRGFKAISDTLWQADVPEVRRFGWMFEQLFVNGQRAQRAKAPNTGYFRVGDFIEGGSDPAPAADTPITQAAHKVTVGRDVQTLLDAVTKAEIQRVQVTYYLKWDITTRRLTKYLTQGPFIYTTGHGIASWNPIRRDTRFTLENVKSALDAPGEWYLETNGTLLYRPRPGETIGEVEALAPSMPQLVIIKGDEKAKVRNVLFENLSFQAAAFTLPFLGLDLDQAASSSDAAIMIDYAENIAFRGCEIARTGASGIWFRRACAGGLIEHCYIHDLGAGGVKIGETAKEIPPEVVTERITVNNSIIQTGGRVVQNAVGVAVYKAHDIAITHNDIADFRWSGVALGWTWGYQESPSARNRVDFNHIHHLGGGVLSDMGGVYHLGPSEGTSITNNVIHHIDVADYGGWGLYLDEGSSHLLLENNLVYACESANFHQHYGKENIIRNNIFARGINGQLQASRIESHLSFTFTHNLVYWDRGSLGVNEWQRVGFATDQNCYWFTGGEFRIQKASWADWQAGGRDQNSIIADPGFVDPENHDYRLKNDDVVKRIGFRPFDFSTAGVYGSDDWKATAKLPPGVEEAFGQ